MDVHPHGTRKRDLARSRLGRFARQRVRARLATLITQGEAALDRRRKAAGARGDHRVCSITSLIEEINTTHAALYGKLATKASEAGLPLDWPSRFFRKSARTKNGPSDDNGPDKPAPVTPKG